MHCVRAEVDILCQMPAPHRQPGDGVIVCLMGGALPTHAGKGDLSGSTPPGWTIRPRYLTLRCRQLARVVAAGLLSLGLLGAAPAGYDQIIEGDAAWDAKNRQAARQHWRAASASPSPAVAAMAELRLLQISGTTGLVAHGVRMELVRLRCTEGTPWCRLAEVDRQLFLQRVGLPHLRRLALNQLAELEGSPAMVEDESLRDAVALRRTWLGTADAPGSPPRPGPGTWTIGVSPLGATGLGGGVSLNFNHPDVALRGGRLSVSMGATTRGNLHGSLSYNSPGRIWWHTGVRTARYERVLLSTASGTTTESWQTLTAEVGPGLRKPWGAFWVGPALVRDAGATTPAQTSGGLEVGARARWGPSRSRLRLLAVAGDYRIASGTGHVSLVTPANRASVRLSLAPTAASPATPAWRIPGWGGGVVLKHGSWQSLRDPLLTGISAEVRSPRVGRFQVATYGEGAMGDRLVGGIGAGLLVGLPPSPQNALRVDAAWGTLGLGISTGWGRAF
jgi:hypothetical protein